MRDYLCAAYASCFLFYLSCNGNLQLFSLFSLSFVPFGCIRIEILVSHYVFGFLYVFPLVYSLCLPILILISILSKTESQIVKDGGSNYQR